MTARESESESESMQTNPTAPRARKRKRLPRVLTRPCPCPCPCPPRMSIGSERAIALAKSGWWHGLPPRQAALFQLLTMEAVMPHSAFHTALQKALGRPVFTHEMVLDFWCLTHELLGGQPAPPPDELLDLLPATKRHLALP